MSSMEKITPVWCVNCGDETGPFTQAQRVVTRLCRGKTRQITMTIYLCDVCAHLMDEED